MGYAVVANMSRSAGEIEETGDYAALFQPCTWKMSGPWQTRWMSSCCFSITPTQTFTDPLPCVSLKPGAVNTSRKAHFSRPVYNSSGRTATHLLLLLLLLKLLKKTDGLHLESLVINCKPFYSPREYSSYVMVGIYRPTR